MRPLFLLLVMLATAALAPLAAGAAAATDASPANPQWVDASFDLAQPNLTHVDLTGTLLAHKYVVNGRSLTATEMSESYQGVADHGAGADGQFVADVEAQMSSALGATLRSAFPGATVVVTSATVDRASLAAPRTDAYDPPIRATVAATIDRPRASVGLGALTDAGVAAVFSAGARIQSTVTLVSDPGYTTTYAIHAPTSPAGLSYASGTEGTISADGATATVTIANLASTRAASQSRALVLHDASATQPSAEDVRDVVDIALGAPQAGVTTLPLAVDITGELRAVDVATRFPNALPPSVQLDFLSADGLRGLRQAGAISDAELASVDGTLLDEARDGLAHALNDSVSAQGGLSDADLAQPVARPYHADAPVRFLATANGTVRIPGAHAGDLDLALDIGATVKFDVALYSSTKPVTFTLHPPAGAVFTDARGNGGGLSSDGLAATYTVAPGAPSPVAGLSMREADAPTYSAEKADLGVLVDLKDLQVTLGGATHHDFGNLVVGVTVTGALDVVSVDKLPQSVQDQLNGPNLELRYLSSDAVRKAVARGLVSQDDLARVEQKLLEETASDLATSMGGAVNVTGGFDESTLATGASADAPVKFVAHASFLKPVSGGSPTDLSAGTSAVALQTIQQSFHLPRVQGLATTYTVILPKGLSVVSVSAEGGTATSGTASDGRSEFVVTPTGPDAAVASVAIGVTPTFVAIKFWPVLLLALLVLLMIAGTPIAIVVARRARKKAGDAPADKK